MRAGNSRRQANPKSCRCGSRATWTIETKCIDGAHLVGDVCDACLANMMRETRPLTNPEVRQWAQQRIPFNG